VNRPRAGSFAASAVQSGLGCSGWTRSLAAWAQPSPEQGAQPKQLLPSTGVRSMSLPESGRALSAARSLRQHGELPGPGGTDTAPACHTTPRRAGPSALPCLQPGHGGFCRERGTSPRGCGNRGSYARWSGRRVLGFGTKQREGSYLANVPRKKGCILVCSHCCIVCG